MHILYWISKRLSAEESLCFLQFSINDEPHGSKGRKTAHHVGDRFGEENALHAKTNGREQQS